jgi:hypothetical protein
MFFKRIVVTIFIVGLFVNGCASKLNDTETLHNKAAELKNFTKKVKGAILRQVPDEQLYIYLQDRYPSELQEFSEYSLQIKNVNGFAVVLLCDKEQTKALIEDISCTGAVEGGELFKQDLECSFQLDVEKECAY